MRTRRMRTRTPINQFAEQFIPEISRQHEGAAFQMPSGVEQWYLEAPSRNSYFKTVPSEKWRRRLPAFLKPYRKHGRSRTAELQMLQGC